MSVPGCHPERSEGSPEHIGLDIQGILRRFTSQDDIPGRSIRPEEATSTGHRPGRGVEPLVETSTRLA